LHNVSLLGTPFHNLNSIANTMQDGSFKETPWILAANG